MAGADASAASRPPPDTRVDRVRSACCLQSVEELRCVCPWTRRRLAVCASSVPRWCAWRLVGATMSGDRPPKRTSDEHRRDTASLVDRQLGAYRISAAIGAGGMGDVYRAHDTRLGRAVALKVLPAMWTADEERRARFEREARVVASLNHPNICTIHDVGRDQGIDYLVMEMIEGESLAVRLARGPLPPTQALARAIEIGDALDKAHRQGIVHRDLKPGNVMLTKAGPGKSGMSQAKLLDFGLARVVTSSSDHTRTGTEIGAVIGTLQYMAPEQIEGLPADERTDNLRVRRAPLRDADRPAGVRGRQRPRRDGGDPSRRATVARLRRAAAPPCARSARADLPGEGPCRPLLDDARRAAATAVDRVERPGGRGSGRNRTTSGAVAGTDAGARRSGPARGSRGRRVVGLLVPRRRSLVGRSRGRHLASPRGR